MRLASLAQDVSRFAAFGCSADFHIVRDLRDYRRVCAHFSKPSLLHFSLLDFSQPSSTVEKSLHSGEPVLRAWPERSPNVARAGSES